MEVVLGVLLVVIFSSGHSLFTKCLLLRRAMHGLNTHTSFRSTPDGEDGNLSRLDVLGRNSSWQDNQAISRLKARLYESLKFQIVFALPLGHFASHNVNSKKAEIGTPAVFCVPR